MRNVTVKAVYTSLGKYYLIYQDGVFLESCDEGEIFFRLQELTS